MNKNIIIVGSGFSGICMGIRLKEAGIHNFIIVEKAHDIGGTWRDNTYPGAACDVKSHLYSFSFEPNPNWSRVFSGQQEILNYLKHCVEKYKLQAHLKFNWELKKANYNDEQANWQIINTNGETLTASILIMGNGALHIAKLPDIKGIENFKGTLFHSSHWNHEYDLSNKTVAVIGTGASAIQFVPEIVPLVKQLYLFQRTAPWILPKPDGEIGNFRKKIYQYFPFTQNLYRQFIYWVNEAQVLGFVVNKDIMNWAAKVSLYHLKKTVKDETLRKKLTPNFHFGCKRVLLTNNYYQSLTKQNVSVVTDAIKSVEENNISTEKEVFKNIDCVICGTGFNVTNAFEKIEFIGSNGVLLNDVWKEGPEAYLGTTISGFPNVFLITGPNTGLGHSSMVYMIESQANYILDAVEILQNENKKSIEVKHKVQEAFNNAIDEKMKQTVWKAGCSSWYLTPKGRNATLWPGFTFQFKKRTLKINIEDYNLK